MRMVRVTVVAVLLGALVFPALALAVTRYGDRGVNRLNGGAGADRLYGLGGNDRLSGRDVLYVNVRSDRARSRNCEVIRGTSAAPPARPGRSVPGGGRCRRSRARRRGDHATPSA